jgi:hypothetical protein
MLDKDVKEIIEENLDIYIYMPLSCIDLLLKHIN